MIFEKKSLHQTFPVGITEWSESDVIICEFDEVFDAMCIKISILTSLIVSAVFKIYLWILRDS